MVGVVAFHEFYYIRTKLISKCFVRIFTILDLRADHGRQNYAAHQEALHQNCTTQQVSPAFAVLYESLSGHHAALLAKASISSNHKARKAFRAECW